MTSIFSKPKIQKPEKIPAAIDPVNIETAGNIPSATSLLGGINSFISTSPGGLSRKAKTKKKTLLGG